ncbi:peptidyl-prolyl cis-trans isomerase [Shimia sediminis]|uniref:peptidylprolyl isomerase n=1 Tax=Shimia sediminis TaxID=2497945 RepID=UPI0013DF6CBE|nr:peptidylprolyl isomerase [Shimia sediminis]
MPFLREPLLHFLLLGAALFAWFAFVSTPEPEPEETNRILIDEQDVERLALRFEAARQRPPSGTELALLVETLIRQEVLVREAEYLGLDIGDEIIRNRLVQKMTFLLESGARSLVPEDEVLRAFMQDNPLRFQQPGWLAFEQVFLGQDMASDAAISEVKAALESGADPQQAGQPSQLPGYVPPSRAAQVDGLLGRGVFATLDTLPSNVWSGPVQSAFGYHLVRITDRAPARLPDFDDVRDAVLREWSRDTAQDLSEIRFDELKASYEIIVPERFGPPAEASQ